MNYYYSIDGTEVVGPNSLDDLTDYFLSGSLPPTTQICAEGSDTWQPIASIVTPIAKGVGQPPAVPEPVQSKQATSNTPSRGKRGIFYYVFWGTISLIGTLAILFLGFVVLSAAGVSILSTVAQRSTKGTSVANAVITQSLPDLTKVEREQAKDLLANLDTRNDEIEGITWYSPLEARGYGTAIYLYIGKKQDSKPWLRWKIRYYGDDWLFIQKYRIKIDDQDAITLLPERSLKRDNKDGSVWEIFDEGADVHAGLLNSILAGNAVYLRMEGSSGINDVELNPQQRQQMQNILLVYRYLGGTWPAR